MIAHAADLGMMFYTGKQFPKKYHNAIFSAQHGSWNAVKPRGARVMVTYLDSKGNASKTELFADGWMTEMGTYLRRPVDVQYYFDGSILVSHIIILTVHLIMIYQVLLIHRYLLQDKIGFQI